MLHRRICRPWTQEEFGVLLDHYEQKGSCFCMEILAALGYERKKRAIGMMARIIGLSYQGQPLTQFKPGHKTYNKGKKMLPHVYKQLIPTMFKPGCKMGQANNNYVQIGHETIRRDGYTWVKTAEKTWRMKHHLVWEKAFGPIPDGCIIVFRDGNPNNRNSSNLEAITRAESLRRNRWGRGPSEYSLIANRAAIIRLKKAGFRQKEIWANPELLQIAKAQTILKLKLKRNESER